MNPIIADLLKKANVPKDSMINFEYFLDVSLEYLKTLENDLLKHKDYEKIKDNFIIDFEKRAFIQIYETIPFSEISDLADDQRIYYPMCCKQEIKRIFDVKTAEDYLLKYRADQILENVRFGRVIRSVRLKSDNWNFTKYFEFQHFSDYLSILPAHEYSMCSQLPYGTIYLKEANGYRLKSPFGDIVVISFSLYYFLYYMTYFHVGYYLKEKSEDLSAAFFIGIKVMLGFEPLDFEFDSRGDLPYEIDDEVLSIVEDQLLFVIGHEYAHHYLNHFTTAAVNTLADKDSVKDHTVYNFSQKQEFEADYYSINKPEIPDIGKERLLNGAFLFFIYLDLYSLVKEYMSPSPTMFKSHPDPIDRLWKLRNDFDSNMGLSTKDLQGILKYYETIKGELLSELPFLIEKIESYDSIYLPSYKKEITNDRLL